MRISSFWRVAMLVPVLALTSPARADDPTNGAGFTTLPQAQAQATDASGKVEVLEFFSYHCPHCFVLDPALDAWVKKHKADVNFRRVHVSWGTPGTTTEKMMTALQRAFYTLEALGKEEALHKPMFDTFHVAQRPLYSEEAVVNYLAPLGIDKQKYASTADSFSVQAKIRQAKKQMQDMKVEGVPAIVVGGRYVTSPALAAKGVRMSEQAQGAEAIKVMDALVARISAERGKKPAAAAAAK